MIHICEWEEWSNKRKKVADFNRNTKHRPTRKKYWRREKKKRNTSTHSLMRTDWANLESREWNKKPKQINCEWTSICELDYILYHPEGMHWWNRNETLKRLLCALLVQKFTSIIPFVFEPNHAHITKMTTTFLCNVTMENDTSIETIDIRQIENETE